MSSQNRNKWTDEDKIRRLDDHGRIVLPSSIRNKFDIQVGDELKFYTTLTDEGYGAICLVHTKPLKQDIARLKVAVAVLQELGEEIPQKLQKSLNEANLELL